MGRYRRGKHPPEGLGMPCLKTIRFAGENLYGNSDGLPKHTFSTPLKALLFLLESTKPLKWVV